MSNFEAFVYGFDAGATITTDSVAKALTPSVKKAGDNNYASLTFTLNLKATRLRVAIESSPDLKNWKEAAVLEEGAVTTDGSLTVNKSTTSELANRGLEQVIIQGLTPLTSNQSAYFRLIFDVL